MRNKFFKSAMALVMALCMVLSVGSMASAAKTVTENQANLHLKVTRAEQTLTAEVSITENTANFKSIQLKLNFDPAQLEYKGNQPGSANMALQFNKTPNARGVLSVIADAQEGSAATGVLYTATFTLKEGAPADASVALDQKWADADNGAKLTFTSEDQKPVVPTGITVSGAVTSYLDDSAVTVALYAADAETPAYQTVAAAGSYTIEGVAPGTYTMKVSKANHVTRSYQVVVADQPVTQDVTINLLGDVTLDGKVNGKDWTRLYDHVNEIDSLDEYAAQCADVILDGRVNGKDWTRLYDHVNEIAPLW